MGLWKRGRRYWTQTVVNGVWIRRPLCPDGSTRATTNWQEAVAPRKGIDPGRLAGQPADAQVTRSSCSQPLTTISRRRRPPPTRSGRSNSTASGWRSSSECLATSAVGDLPRMIEGFQAKRRLEGAGNRTVNMDIGALRQVLKRFKQWRRLEDDVKMLTESGGEPIGRVLTSEEQERLLKAAEANPEWEHVWCAAQLAANTSMRGVEVKHVRRKDFDAEKRVVHIRASKNETSKRVIPLNDSAFDAVQRMVTRADKLGHSEPHHYLWCASQHHKLDPTKPASKWDTAWRALRDEAGLPGLRFHDLRHTVVTRLLEAGEPDHVVESITGHLSRRMLEHYSHIRLKAKKAALDRLDGSTKGTSIKRAK